MDNNKSFSTCLRVVLIVIFIGAVTGATILMEWAICVYAGYFIGEQAYKKERAKSNENIR